MRFGPAQSVISHSSQAKRRMHFLHGLPAKVYTPTPIIYGDLLYVIADNGVLSTYDAKTGAVVYQQRMPSTFSASPVAADGRVYPASEDGDVL